MLAAGMGAGVEQFRHHLLVQCSLEKYSTEMLILKVMPLCQQKFHQRLPLYFLPLVATLASICATVWCKHSICNRFAVGVVARCDGNRSGTCCVLYIQTFYGIHHLFKAFYPASCETIDWGDTRRTCRRWAMVRLWAKP